MKTWMRVACFILVAGLWAIPAHAQTPIDPVVLVNRTDPPPPNYTLTVAPTQSLPFQVLYSALPITIEWSPTNGTDLLHQLFIEFMSVPSNLSLSGSSDIWGQWQIITGTPPGDVELEFYNQFSSPEPCIVNNAVASCQGYMSPGESASISLSPEPKSALLFGTGLALFFLITRRRMLPQSRKELA